MKEGIARSNKNRTSQDTGLLFLNNQQVVMIDEALSNLGKYGEVRLVVEKGILRYIVTQNSVDVFKYRVGDFREQTKGE